MTARSESVESVADTRTSRQRFWRYAPLVFWLFIIFYASTGEMSASNTSRIVRPLLLWLRPDISEGQMISIHFLVRKAAHFAEYAVLAFLAARAFISSSQNWLWRRWFIASFVLVVLVSFIDEYNQSFVASRTGSIYDSFIDIAGGLTMLAIYTLWQRRKNR